MKYVICVIAVILEYLVYSMIGVALGWRHGGGFLPMLLLYSAMAATCRAIIKYFNNKKENSVASKTNDDEET